MGFGRVDPVGGKVGYVSNECDKCKYERLLSDSGFSWTTFHMGRYVPSKGYTKWAGPIGLTATVEVVEVSDDYDESFDRDNSRVAYIIFKIVDGDKTLYFRKAGTANSYGDVSWDGLFQDVTPVEKTVTAYEVVK